MSNIKITNIDLGDVFYKTGPGKDELLTFSSAGTLKAGTILARGRKARAVRSRGVRRR